VDKQAVGNNPNQRVAAQRGHGVGQGERVTDGAAQRLGQLVVVDGQ
jgi:hypothetical protein